MSAYIKSTDVNLASNSKFIQVNDGANIGNIREGWPVAINGIVIGFAKVVNTSAAPPTIELYEAYTGSAITGGVLLTFPSQGQLTVIGDRITALTNTYEALANSVSIAPSANSVVKRDASGKVKTANAVDANDAVALGQLGTAATRNVGTASGNVMGVGAFGLGSASTNGVKTDFSFISGSSVSEVISVEGTHYGMSAVNRPAGLFTKGAVPVANRWSFIGVADQIELRAFISNPAGDAELWHSANTTVDTNGFVKQASPIIRLYADHIESNEQVDSAIFTKNAVGDYTITGTEGFAQEGWYIETPKDRDGFPKVLVDYQQDENGTIHVQCYEFNFNRELTTKVDIPDGRWIDIRLHKTTAEPAEEDAEQE